MTKADLARENARLRHVNAMLKATLREVHEFLREQAAARVEAQGPVVPRPHPDRRPTVQ